MSHDERDSQLGNCIFCGTEITAKNYSKEHVFPASIGGWFWIESVGACCNKKFGDSFDSDLRMNRFVFYADEKLGFRKNDNFLTGQRITWESERGHQSRLIRGGPGRDWKIGISPQPDGSWIADDDIGKQRIVADLRKQGRSEEFIRINLLDPYDLAPDGVRIPIRGTGHSFVRHKDVSSTIQYDDLTAPIRFALIAKIAIEVYHCSELSGEFNVDLTDAKRAVIENDPTRLVSFGPPGTLIGRADKITYKPFHVITFGVEQGVLIAIVFLFGRLRFVCALGTIVTAGIGSLRTEYFAFPFDERHIDWLPPDPQTAEESEKLFEITAESWHSRESVR